MYALGSATERSSELSPSRSNLSGVLQHQAGRRTGLRLTLCSSDRDADSTRKWRRLVLQCIYALVSERSAAAHDPSAGPQKHRELTHRIDWVLSTARPLTPNLWPPGEFASGNTAAHQHGSCWSSTPRCRASPRNCGAGRTIAYPLARFFGHLGETPRRNACNISWALELGACHAAATSLQRAVQEAGRARRAFRLPGGVPATGAWIPKPAPVQLVLVLAGTASAAAARRPVQTTAQLPAGLQVSPPG